MYAKSRGPAKQATAKIAVLLISEKYAKCQAVDIK